MEVRVYVAEGSSIDFELPKAISCGPRLDSNTFVLVFESFVKDIDAEALKRRGSQHLKSEVEYIGCFFDGVEHMAVCKFEINPANATNVRTASPCAEFLRCVSPSSAKWKPMSVLHYRILKKIQADALKLYPKWFELEAAREEEAPVDGIGGRDNDGVFRMAGAFIEEQEEVFQQWWGSYHLKAISCDYDHLPALKDLSSCQQQKFSIVDENIEEEPVGKKSRERQTVRRLFQLVSCGTDLKKMEFSVSKLKQEECPRAIVLQLEEEGKKTVSPKTCASALVKLMDDGVAPVLKRADQYWNWPLVLSIIHETLSVTKQAERFGLGDPGRRPGSRGPATPAYAAFEKEVKDVFLGHSESRCRQCLGPVSASSPFPSIDGPAPDVWSKGGTLIQLLVKSHSDEKEVLTWCCLPCAKQFVDEMECEECGGRARVVKMAGSMRIPFDDCARCSTERQPKHMKHVRSEARRALVDHKYLGPLLSRGPTHSICS